jgi:hypothetical protein
MRGPIGKNSDALGLDENGIPTSEELRRLSLGDLDGKLEKVRANLQ